MVDSVVGAGVVRRDLRVKLTGEARYAADLKLPGMLCGAILRSPHPHAELRRLDAGPSLAQPGVWAAVTPFDAPAAGRMAPDLAILDTRLRFVGDEVAAVAADDPDAARRALQWLQPEYRLLPHLSTPQAALAPGAIEIHPGLHPAGGNLATGEALSLERGEVAAGFAAADFTLEETYRIPTHSAAPLEPRAALAAWNHSPEFDLTIWKATRGVHVDRAALAAALRLPEQRIRIVGPFLGAGYGNKDETRLAALAAILAQRAGRPVRLEYSREDEFTAGRVRHAAEIYIKAGFTAAGAITAISAEALLDTGAYLASGAGVARRCGQGILYLYHCANVRYRARLAYTNRPTAGSYRALGAPQGHFALESLMDQAAERLGIDPLEFRRRNHVRPEGQPGQRITPAGQIVDSQPVEGGIPFSSNGLAQCLEIGAAAFGWQPGPPSYRRHAATPAPNHPADSQSDTPAAIHHTESAAQSVHPAPPQSAAQSVHPAPPQSAHPEMAAGWGGDADWRRGQGMAMMLYRGGPGWESSAEVRVERSGAVKLITGLMEVGEGATTVLPQMAAEVLGAAYEQVEPVFADTAATPAAPITAGSTATFSTGTAVVQAAREVRRTLLELASSVLEAPAEALDAAAGEVFVKDDPSRRMPLAQVAGMMPDAAITAYASVTPGSPDYIVNSFGAHFVEVAVDAATGKVRVLRYVAAHDSGRIINPRTALNQVEGGVCQMLGLALSEELITDAATGVTLNPGYLEHKSPTIQDYPDLQVLFTDAPDPVGPLGAKGLGEVPSVGVIAAIANAIYDATGLRLTHPPFTPDRVLAALAEGNRNG